MGLERSYVLPPRVLLLLLVAAFLPGCIGGGMGGSGPNPVTGFITPEHFRFHTVRKAKGPGPGGWQAVCIHATVKNGSMQEVTACQFEVGMPVRSDRDGELARLEAQRRCAYWANRAAHAVLSSASPGALTAVLCNQFKATYRALLADAIAGSSVSECVTRGLVPVVLPFTSLPSPL
jgi:hypothetical protein